MNVCLLLYCSVIGLLMSHDMTRGSATQHVESCACLCVCVYVFIGLVVGNNNFKQLSYVHKGEELHVQGGGSICIRGRS